MPSPASRSSAAHAGKNPCPINFSRPFPRRLLPSPSPKKSGFGSSSASSGKGKKRSSFRGGGGGSPYGSPRGLHRASAAIIWRARGSGVGLLGGASLNEATPPLQVTKSPARTTPSKSSASPKKELSRLYARQASLIASSRQHPLSEAEQLALNITTSDILLVQKSLRTDPLPALPFALVAKEEVVPNRFAGGGFEESIGVGGGRRGGAASGGPPAQAVSVVKRSKVGRSARSPVKVKRHAPYGRSNPNLDPTPRPSLTTASTSDRPLASDTTDYEWKPPSLCPSLSNIHSTFSPPQLPPQPAPSPSLSAFLETAPSTRTASTSRPKPDLKSKIHGLVKTLKRKASRGTIKNFPLPLDPDREEFDVSSLSTRQKRGRPLPSGSSSVSPPPPMPSSRISEDRLAGSRPSLNGKRRAILPSADDVELFPPRPSTSQSHHHRRIDPSDISAPFPIGTQYTQRSKASLSLDQERDPRKRRATIGAGQDRLAVSMTEPVPQLPPLVTFPRLPFPSPPRPLTVPRSPVRPPPIPSPSYVNVTLLSDPYRPPPPKTSVITAARSTSSLLSPTSTAPRLKPRINPPIRTTFNDYIFPADPSRCQSPPSQSSGRCRSTSTTNAQTNAPLCRPLPPLPSSSSCSVPLLAAVERPFVHPRAPTPSGLPFISSSAPTSSSTKPPLAAQTSSSGSSLARTDRTASNPSSTTTATTENSRTFFDLPANPPNKPYHYIKHPIFNHTPPSADSSSSGSSYSNPSQSTLPSSSQPSFKDSEISNQYPQASLAHRDTLIVPPFATGTTSSAHRSHHTDRAAVEGHQLRRRRPEAVPSRLGLGDSSTRGSRPPKRRNSTSSEDSGMLPRKKGKGGGWGGGYC